MASFASGVKILRMHERRHVPPGGRDTANSRHPTAVWTGVLAVVVAVVAVTVAVAGATTTGSLREHQIAKTHRIDSTHVIHNLADGVQAFTSNAFLVSGPASADAPATTDDGDHGRRVLVDTGANFDVVAAVREHVADLDAVVLTHTHSDHVGNVEAVRDAFGVETWGFDTDQPSVDNELPDGDTVEMGLGSYEALHTPGHKNDHLCFYDEAAGVLFAGDLIFQHGGFGRTDLDEGDRPTLIRSVDRVRDRVGDDLAEMHVGHGPSVLESPLDHVELAARAARTR